MALWCELQYGGLSVTMHLLKMPRQVLRERLLTNAAEQLLTTRHLAHYGVIIFVRTHSFAFVLNYNFQFKYLIIHFEDAG